jgi:hypothetical protein
MENVKRQRPKVEEWKQKRLRKLAPEFQNEIRQMATYKTFEEFLDLAQQMAAQAKQLELRAWFIRRVAMEKLRAEVAAREENAA